MKEKTQTDQRLKYRRQIQKMINKDQITAKSQWIKIFKKIKDKDWYQNVLS